MGEKKNKKSVNRKSSHSAYGYSHNRNAKKKESFNSMQSSKQSTFHLADVTEEYIEHKDKILTFINDAQYKPLKYKEFLYLFQIGDDKKKELSMILQDLITEGKIMLTPKGKYQQIAKGYLVGVFEGNQKGFGFVTVEGETEDYFIPARNSMGALHKDHVMIEILDEVRGKSKEARVVKILQHGIHELVGTYQESKGFGFVVPDNTKYNKDIFISKAFANGAVTGHKVVVKLVDFGNEEKKPEGRITEIIGHINDPGTDIMSIIRAYDLPIHFNDAIMTQLETIPDEISEKDKEGRLDLRNLPTVTIDGEDAKDLDDAITLTEEENHYVLGVHIADVTNYVSEHSALDAEALKRGTSVYLVDCVIPMLPHKLSNGICSLNEGRDRLALSCIMQIDKTGKVIGHRIAETVINVTRRMSYTSVKKILEDHDNLEMDKYKELIPMFETMQILANLLREKRENRGSIDFDFPESKIVLNDKGEPIDIKSYERNSATKIIEDFMLLANETVAEDYYWQEIPFVYRTHEAPDPEKLNKLSVLIHNFGYYFKAGTDDIHPKEFQKLLQKIEGSNEEALISRLTLRSMKQAKYTTACSGHFGLSTKYYCHFTSPIRRYPDLQIHRIIKENLHGSLSEKRLQHYDKILPIIADSTSKNERRADEVEREVEKLKKVQYMASRIGNVYEGVISGISNYGMYVELPNTVEGLVHVTTLCDDYYLYDEAQYAMIGKESGKQYSLGQKVSVVVKQVDRILRTIDFELTDDSENKE